MAWLSKVNFTDSFGNLGDLAGAVNKLSESVKNIEKNFDSALGWETAASEGPPEGEGGWGASGHGAEPQLDLGGGAPTVAAASEDAVGSRPDLSATVPAAAAVAAAAPEGDEVGPVGPDAAGTDGLRAPAQKPQTALQHTGEADGGGGGELAQGISLPSMGCEEEDVSRQEASEEAVVPAGLPPREKEDAAETMQAGEMAEEPPGALPAAAEAVDAVAAAATAGLASSDPPSQAGAAPTFGTGGEGASAGKSGEVAPMINGMEAADHSGGAEVGRHPPQASAGPEADAEVLQAERVPCSDALQSEAVAVDGSPSATLLVAAVAGQREPAAGLSREDEPLPMAGSGPEVEQANGTSARPLVGPDTQPGLAFAEGVRIGHQGEMEEVGPTKVSEESSAGATANDRGPSEEAETGQPKGSSFSSTGEAVASPAPHAREEAFDDVPLGSGGQPASNPDSGPAPALATGRADVAHVLGASIVPQPTGNGEPSESEREAPTVAEGSQADHSTGEQVAPRAVTAPETLLAENADLRAQLSGLQLAMQAAARQSQAKADELARMEGLNDDLRAQLEGLQGQGQKASEAELDALREEYQQRLSAADRKVYALTKERDMLRREQNRKSDTSALLKEKDEIIKQVMAEGEELSKRQAVQEGQMKKLRAQIREMEDERQRLTSRLQVEEARVESTRKDKAATEKALQDAVERSHAELAAQKEAYEAAVQEARASQAAAEQRVNSEVKADLERRLRDMGERELHLVASVDELRAALSHAQQEAAFREDVLRRDIESVKARCQAAEALHQDLEARIPESTRPLLRRIEAMQSERNVREEALRGVERSLNGRLQDAEAKAAVAQERERASQDRLSQALSRVAVMEAQLAFLRTEHAQLVRSLDKERQRAVESRQDYLSAVEAAATHEGRAAQLEQQLKDVLAAHKAELAHERAAREALEREAEAERAAAAEYEKRIRAEGRTAAEKAVVAAANAPTNAGGGGGGGRRSMEDGNAYLAGSLHVQQLLPDAGQAPPFWLERSSSSSSNKGATPEQLETLLRYREGELASYTARLAALESTRDSLAEELVSTTQQSETLRAEVASLPGLRAELEALRRRHSSALELMGERDEQVEELRADLQDVKQMYREQIDMLVGQIERISSQISVP